MSYADTLDYLYHIAPAFEKVGAQAYKEGLANTYTLHERYHHPYRHYPCIHVAGTNGKGSVSHTLAAILHAAGYRVGLYTSPHLQDFSERIRVDGVPISHERVIAFVEEGRGFFETLAASFFEITTVLALQYFAEQKVDIAVIEVGMGGRLDCTNIVSPLLSIITNISRDHTHFLGETIARIAREKGGIIKSHTPCLIGDDNAETRPVFEEIAQEKEAPLFFAQPVSADIPFSLTGACQQENRNTILCAIPLLRQHLVISDEAVREGCAHVCEKTGLRGRWEEVQTSPRTICDTGHNLAAWQYLAPQIAAISAAKQREGQAARIVFGMVDDKDIAAVIALLPATAHYYFCQASIPRALSSAIILHLAQERGLTAEAYPTVPAAYEAARRASGGDDFLFVGGSTYVVADFLNYLEGDAQ